MAKTIECDAILTGYKELYNHDCPDGVRYAGWELTLLLDKPPRLEGTDIKVVFAPSVPTPGTVAKAVLRKLKDRGLLPKPEKTLAGESLLLDVLVTKKRKWLEKDLTLTEELTLCGPGAYGVPLGNQRVLVTVLDPESEPEPEPLCPVCGKPTGEHRDGLFCCPKCHGVRPLRQEDHHYIPVKYAVKCPDCGIQTRAYDFSDGAASDWNRRA